MNTRGTRLAALLAPLLLVGCEASRPDDVRSVDRYALAETDPKAPKQQPDEPATLTPPRARQLHGRRPRT